jgi:hypothetical protein
MKSKQEEFIEMVLTCADEIGTTTDNSTLITLMLYKIDNLDDKLDCVQEHLQDIENKIDVLYKLLYK